MKHIIKKQVKNILFNLYDIKINSNVQIDKKGLIFNIDYK